MTARILIATLLMLSACSTCPAPDIMAEYNCLERGYSKGSTLYEHCLIDEQKTAKTPRKNHNMIR